MLEDDVSAHLDTEPRTDYANVVSKRNSHTGYGVAYECSDPDPILITFEAPYDNTNLSAFVRLIEEHHL